MRPHERIIALASLAALLLAACGAATSPSPQPAPAASAVRASVIPVIVSAEQVVGPNRFLFSFLDPDTNQPTRVGHKQVEGKWVRASKRSGAVLDRPQS